MSEGNDMLILGIETSCDETSVAVVSDGKKVLSNIIASSLHLHKRYGGIVPEIACRHHTESINVVLETALKQAKVTLRDIDCVAVTQGPGLVGALLVGISLAKALSYSLKVPLIAVNHIHGHLYSALMNGGEITFPAIGLVVSGGHTSLLYMEDISDIKVLGHTRDDAAGEAFDKVARILGLGFPGGPIIEKRAKDGNVNRIRFPRSYLKDNSFDFSFSGIKTAVLYYVRDVREARERMPVNDICAAFQEAVIDMLVDKTKNACIRRKVKTVLLGGGVSANKRLRQQISDMLVSENIRVSFPPAGMYTDNAAMIAGLGQILYNKGRVSHYHITAQANMTIGSDTLSSKHI